MGPRTYRNKYEEGETFYLNLRGRYQPVIVQFEPKNNRERVMKQLNRTTYSETAQPVT